MHHWLRYFSLFLALILVVGGITGCSNDDTGKESSKPTFEVVLGTVNPSSATLNLKTKGITECAWICYPAAEAQQLEPAAIFATGTTVACKDGDTSFDIPNLEPVSEYIVYLAAKTTGAFYDGKIAPVSFTTTDFTDEVSIVKRTLDGFVAHINLPEDVIERGNVVKWQVSNIFMYNMLKARNLSDAEMLESNDEYYGKYFQEAATLTIDEEHRVKLDENGDPIEKWVFIAPGEPLVLMFGEHEYGESMWGWGEGWYNAMFDYDAYFEAIGGGGGGVVMSPGKSSAGIDESEFWSGYYKKLELRAEEPTVLNGKVGFETVGLRPNGGVLRFAPSDNVMQYCVGIFDNATYEGTILPMLDNNESYLQWFTSSLDAMLQFGVRSLSGPSELSLEEVFYSMTPDVPYHVLITAMGDEFGKAQFFAHETFTLPQPVLPAPQIVVTPTTKPDGPASPYEAWFNVKCPTKDVTKVGYACNYARDFIFAINDGGTYADLIGQANNGLSAEEIAQINSDAGFNMMFTSREDAITRLAVMGWNVEGTDNNPDEANSSAVADQKTIRLPDADHVVSSLFTDLLGDWTATATVRLNQYNYDKQQYEWIDIAEPVKTKVSLASGVSYPATLPAEVYELYPDKTKAEVDALYTEFKNSAEAFKQKVRGQNRILCLGFDFNVNKEWPVLGLKTPYELFIDTEYGAAVTTDDLFYDFGPKWYLQIAADGKVFVPVNVNRLLPMSVWAEGNEYNLVSADLESALYLPAGENMENVEKWPNIPVEVSADKKTITLKKVEYTTADNVKLDLYPSVIVADYSGMSLFPTKISSEVVLTKGWTEPAATSTKVSGKIAPSLNKFIGEPLKAINGASVLKPQQRPSARTPISKVAPVKYKRVENFQILSQEQIEKNLDNYADQMKKRAARK